MPVRVGVVLAGCGALDGTDVHEAVCCFLSLVRREAEVTALAPDAAQYRVANHVTGQPAAEERNMLVESARLWKKLTPLAAADPASLDSVLIPGGFGAARTLCDMGSRLEAMSLRPDLAALLNALADQGKPLAAVCAGTAILAGLMRDRSVRGARVAVTAKEHWVKAVIAMGQTPVDAGPTGVVVDEPNRLVSGHGYMLARGLVQVAEGIDRVVEELLRRIPQDAAARTR